MKAVAEACGVNIKSQKAKMGTLGNCYKFCKYETCVLQQFIDQGFSVKFPIFGLEPSMMA